jgi:hypothetical protein
MKINKEKNIFFTRNVMEEEYFEKNDFRQLEVRASVHYSIIHSNKKQQFIKFYFIFI